MTGLPGSHKKETTKSQRYCRALEESNGSHVDSVEPARHRHHSQSQAALDVSIIIYSSISRVHKLSNWSHLEDHCRLAKTPEKVWSWKGWKMFLSPFGRTTSAHFCPLQTGKKWGWIKPLNFTHQYDPVRWDCLASKHSNCFIMTNRWENKNHLIWPLVLPGIHIREDERDFSNRIEILDLISAITSDCSKNCKPITQISQYLFSFDDMSYEVAAETCKIKDRCRYPKIIRSDVTALRNGIIREELHRSCLLLRKVKQTRACIYQHVWNWICFEVST